MLECLEEERGHSYINAIGRNLSSTPLRKQRDYLRHVIL